MHSIKNSRPWKYQVDTGLPSGEVERSTPRPSWSFSNSAPIGAHRLDDSAVLPICVVADRAVLAESPRMDRGGAGSAGGHIVVDFRPHPAWECRHTILHG